MLAMWWRHSRSESPQRSPSAVGSAGDSNSGLLCTTPQVLPSGLTRRPGARRVAAPRFVVLQVRLRMRPPSTRMHTPVMKLDSSEARKTARLATSQPVP